MIFDARFEPLKLGNFIQPTANNEITRFHILTIHRSRIPKTLLLSIRSSRRLEASLWHVSSILIPRGHGWCVEDRGESRNSFTNLEQGKAMARYRYRKWHGLEITIRIPNRWTKAWETRSSNNWGERMGDDSMAGELALVDSHADCHTTRSAFWNCNSRAWTTHDGRAISLRSTSFLRDLFPSSNVRDGGFPF